MTAPHVIDTHPDRFGWRIWKLTLDPPRLRSPFEQSGALLRPGPALFAAVCPSGRCVLRFDARCTCGVHYVPTVRGFGFYLRTAGPFGDCTTITFGAALGDVAIDPRADWCRAAQHYLVLAAAVPERYAALADPLAAEYCVPVDPFRRSKTTPTLRRMEHRVRAALAHARPAELFNPGRHRSPFLHHPHPTGVLT
ncbi:Uncharacterised protein [Mycolicibacterium fortuitum]|uniref:Uncharacterized protein n=1 Tax=Mycolicibacterium fortuitum TaxID=1766 RepID=A0A378V018_MYCFO|nr:Uncharacterised protein [Mycolicibacterium fortuitum]